MSENLTWKEHYNYILSQIYKILGLLQRTFDNVVCIQAKKILYLSLVRSQLIYCSPVWHPQFINDITTIENVQRRATKFILNDFFSDYKSRLIKLNLLPLMMYLEINDIMCFVKYLKDHLILGPLWISLQTI